MPVQNDTERVQALQSVPEPTYHVSPDAMGAAASHVEREYGYGYRIGIAAASYSGDGLFHVVASDGSRFRLYVDKWGNVERIPDAR